jgi:hypothetical protein
MQIYLMNTADVQAVCNAVWTQDVKDAYATFKAAQEAELGG